MKLLRSLIAFASIAPAALAGPVAIEERAISSNWAGVNSYFLHAFKQYAQDDELSRILY